MKIDDYTQYYGLLKDFIYTMNGITNDHFETFESTASARREYLSAIEEGEVSGIPASFMRELQKERVRRQQTSIALFIYAHSSFERYLSKLFKTAIKSNEQFWDLYLMDIMRSDKANRGNSKYKKIRNLRWDKSSSNKKKEIGLKRFRDVFGNTSSYLVNASKYCGMEIKKTSIYWDRKKPRTKNLIYDYSEICARRNLFVHRGVRFDQNYLDDLDFEIKYRYKNYAYEDQEIKNRKIRFSKTGYYVLRKSERELVGKTALFLPSYMSHTTRTLTLLYVRFWSKIALMNHEQKKNYRSLYKEANKKSISYADFKNQIDTQTDPNNLITSILHDLLIESHNHRQVFSVLTLAEEIFLQYISEAIMGNDIYAAIDERNMDDIKRSLEEVGCYALVDYLLIKSEQRKYKIQNINRRIKHVKTNGEKEKLSNLKKFIRKDKRDLEQLCESIIDEQDDPIYSVALSLIGRRKKEAIKRLNNVRNLDKNSTDWFMFHEVSQDPKYKKEFSKAIKRATRNN